MAANIVKRLEETGQLQQMHLMGRVLPLGSLRRRKVRSVLSFVADSQYAGRTFTKTFCRSVLNQLYHDHALQAADPAREACRLKRALRSAKRALRSAGAMSMVDSAETQARVFCFPLRMLGFEICACKGGVAAQLQVRVRAIKCNVRAFTCLRECEDMAEPRLGFVSFRHAWVTAKSKERVAGGAVEGVCGWVARQISTSLKLPNKSETVSIGVGGKCKKHDCFHP